MEASSVILVVGIGSLLLFYRKLMQHFFPLCLMPWISYRVPFTSATKVAPGVLSAKITEALSRKGPVVRIGANEIAIAEIGVVRRIYASFAKWPKWYETPPALLFYGYVSTWCGITCF